MPEPSQSFITWVETYRGYDPVELDKEIASLKQQKSIFSTQAAGSKSFTRDLAELRDQLGAASRVKAERSRQNTPTSGTLDYTQLNVS